MTNYKEVIKNIIKIIYCIVFPLFMLKVLFTYLDWPDVFPMQGAVFIATFCLTIAAICTLSAVGFLVTYFYF